MKEAAEIRRSRAVALILSYVVSGGFVLVFTLAGRRPWTGVAVFFVLTWAFQVHVSGRPWGELGLPFRLKGCREWLAGAVAGGALFTGVALCMMATGTLLLAKGGSFGEGREIAVVLAVAALIEEMLFRGYPLQTLSRAWGEGSALGATSAAFALAHMVNPGAGAMPLLGVFLGGWALGAACLRWRSLWVSWGAHFGWNAVQVLVFGFPVGGTPVAALGGAAVYAARLRGPSWLTGGVFGPEASLPAILVLGAAVWGISGPIMSKQG